MNPRRDVLRTPESTRRVCPQCNGSSDRHWLSANLGTALEVYLTLNRTLSQTPPEHPRHAVLVAAKHRAAQDLARELALLRVHIMPHTMETLPEFTLTFSEFTEFWNQLTPEQQLAWTTASGAPVCTLSLVTTPPKPTLRRNPDSCVSGVSFKVPED